MEVDSDEPLLPKEEEERLIREALAKQEKYGDPPLSELPELKTDEVKGAEELPPYVPPNRNS